MFLPAYQIVDYGSMLPSRRRSPYSGHSFDMWPLDGQRQPHLIDAFALSSPSARPVFERRLHPQSPLHFAPASLNVMRNAFDALDDVLQLVERSSANDSAASQLQQHHSGAANVRLADDRMQVDVHVSGFAPEELSVRIKDNERTLVIEGKHEARSEDGCSFMHREFRREFQVPAEHKLDEVQTRLNPADGLLSVCVPRSAPAIKDSTDATKEGRSVQIQQVKPQCVADNTETAAQEHNRQQMNGSEKK